MDIKKLFQVVFPPHLRISAYELRRRLRNNYYIIHTLDDIGFSLLYKHKKVYHLDYLGVDPSSQGKGIGKQLLLHLTKKYKKVCLECETSLVSYYTKVGFKDSTIDYRWNNVKLHLMVYGLSTFDLHTHYTYLQRMLYTVHLLVVTSIPLFFISIRIARFLFDKHHAWNER